VVKLLAKISLVFSLIFSQIFFPASTSLKTFAATASKSPTASNSPSSSQSSTPSSSTTPKPTKKVTKKPVQKTPAPPLEPRTFPWPPTKDFTGNGGAFAKIVTWSEMIEAYSSNKTLNSQKENCLTKSCGAVIVTAEYRCEWWEIRANALATDVNDSKKITNLGALRTTSTGTDPKQYTTILLVSEEPLAINVNVGNISAICHKRATNETIPTTTYTPTRDSAVFKG
jgi:hypothetical protein